MTGTIVNKNRPTLLMMIVTMLYLVVTAFFEEGVAYFDPVYTTLMSSAEFYLTFSICAVLFLAVVYLAKHYFQIRVNFVFLSLIAVMFLVNLIAVLIFPEFTVSAGLYHVSNALRIRYITFWLAACLAFYVFFAIMPKIVADNREWNVYFFGGVIIALSACLFSYIVERQAYSSVLNPSEDPYHYTFVSFTNNRNTYGILLFIGVVCSLYLHAYEQKWYFVLLAFFFFVNLILVMSRSALICAAIYIVLYFSLFIVKRFKAHLATSLILLMIFLFLVVFPFLLKPLGIVDKSPVLAKYYSYVVLLFDPSDKHGNGTFDSRLDIWSLLLMSLFKSPSYVLFGFGDWNLTWFLGTIYRGYPVIESTHNGFFDVFCRMGLFGVILLLGETVLFFYCLAQNYKHKVSFNSLPLFLFICVFIHGLVEDTNYLNMQAKDMMLLFMTYMPVLTNYQLSKKTETKVNWENEYSSARVYHSKHSLFPLQWSQLAYIVLTPAFAIVIGLSRFFSIWNGVLFIDSIFFQLQLVLLFLFLPAIIYSLVFHKNTGSKKRFSFVLTLCLVWALSCVVTSVLAQNIISFLVLLSSGLFILIFSFVGVDKKDLKQLAVSSSIFLCLEVVLVLTSKMIIQYCLIPDEIYQPYAAMCLIILDFIVPFLVIVASPLHKTLIGSFDKDWWHIEIACRSIWYRQQVKYEIRLMKAFQRKPVLRNQK
jgi:hypothetical protein